jgi:DNA-binding transcriptional ArsR family regulator
MPNTIAVVTADMVNSTLFQRGETSSWLNELLDTLKDSPDYDWIMKPEIYRGDSFQCVLKTPENVLKLSVLARVLMRKHSEKTDLRIAIGIGTGDELTDRAGTSDGEAFRLSGHLADNIRKQKARIGIALPVSSEPLSATLDLLETIVGNWSPAQSEVIAALLQNESITKISERLAISQPAVSQRLSASKWWAVEHFLDTFPQHLALYTNTAL